MAVVLAGTGAFLVLRFSSELDSALDRALKSRADELAVLVANGDAELRRSRVPRLVEADEGFTQVLRSDGSILDATPLALKARALDSEQIRLAVRRPLFVDRTSQPPFDDKLRLLARPVTRGGRTVILVVGSSLDERDESLSSLRKQLLIGGPVALLLASLAGYGLATAALRPVESMRRQAAEISRVDSGGRLPVASARDELSQLGETLNDMLGRLERSVQRERGFVASASHELRTPLTLLKGELELANRDGRSPEELRRAVASAAEETDRLTRLAEDLLVLARSDEGRLPVRPESLRADELLESVARRFGPRAAETRRMLGVDAAPGLAVEADRLRLEQALGNLVDNALRHGAGRIGLSATEDGDSVTFAVADEGEGFPPDMLGAAFDRFTRGDAARGRGGTGLGLAIVEAVARAHGGEAGVSAGARVWIRIQALTAASSRAPRTHGAP